MWRVANGVGVNIWKYPWVPKFGPLTSHLTSPNTHLEEMLCICDISDINGVWILEKIDQQLPDAILNDILSLNFHSDTKGDDCVLWKLAKDGKFSTSFMYEALLGIQSPNSRRIFKLI